MKGLQFYLIGGGELTSEELDVNQSLLNLVNKPSPRLCFIPTASNDAEGYIETFQKYFSALGAVVSVIRQDSDNSLAEKLAFDADIIYVGGGSTSSLLKKWQETGRDRIFVAAAKNGRILSGISAGAMCWYESALVRESSQYKLIAGLGLLPGTLVTHFLDFDFQRVTQQHVQDGNITMGLALADSSAVHIVDGKIVAKVGRGLLLPLP